MPCLWEAITEVIALLVSDIHLSHVPRRHEVLSLIWYEAQARILRQLRSLQDTFMAFRFICAGYVLSLEQPT